MGFDEFVNQYYRDTYRYIYGLCKRWHTGDTSILVEDLNQQLWENAFKHFDKLKAADEPLAYLRSMASNLVSQQKNDPGLPLPEAESLGGYADASPDLSAKIAYLHNELVPKLSCKQRLAYLLYHESELWEGEVRLGWQELAKLNGMSVEQATEKFERARASLMQVYHRDEGWDSVDIDCEEMLVYLVWTQAQRANKKGKFTWQYFADLLSVKPNVLIVRYRDAVRNLEKGMQERFGEHWNRT